MFQVADHLLHQMTREQHQRQETLQAACRKNNISQEWNPDKVKKYASHFIVENHYKILFQFIPKVSCTSWKRVFQMMASKHRPWVGSLYLSKYPYEEIMEKMATYRKVIFVREPITRLLSAYLSKFRRPDRPELQSIWEASFGRLIVQLYRGKNHDTAKPSNLAPKNSDLNSMSNITLNELTRDTAKPSNLAPKTSDLNSVLNITLNELIRFITDLEGIPGWETPVSVGPDHWLPISRVSNACVMKYDFIGRFENLAVEAPYVLKWLGVEDDVVRFPAVHSSNAARALVTEYRKVRLDSLKRLRSYYRLDYEMFGYSFNDTLSLLMNDVLEGDSDTKAPLRLQNLFFDFIST